MIALQDDGANLHRFDVSHKKAYTALVYRRPSKDVVQGWSKKKLPNRCHCWKAQCQIHPSKAPSIWAEVFRSMAGSEVVGAIAVSGGPNWDMDEACANAGLAKVADKLK